MIANAAFKPPVQLRVAPAELVTIFTKDLGGRLYGSPIVSSIPAKIVTDSRHLEAGCIFIAIRGFHHDGHSHIDEALKCGATMVVCEDSPVPLVSSIATVVQVESTRAAWSHACSIAMGSPSNGLKMVGITGTNGKTSTVWMIKAILSAMGHKTASVGTVGYIDGDGHHYETKHTTPDPDALYPMLRHAVDQGCKVVVMEVSSHSIEQKKVTPIVFDVAGFTSFSQDHLDLHGTMAAYLDAKLVLFEKLLRPGGNAIIHKDVWPLVSERIPSETNTKIYGFNAQALNGQIAFSCKKLFATRGISNIEIANVKEKKRPLIYTIPFVGEVFIENFTCALLSSGAVTGTSVAEPLAMELARFLKPVPGRLEPVTTTKPWRPVIFVDYAHTPDALEKTLLDVRKLALGKLICVFGCGGDRDRSKRPIMGSIAERLSDHVIVTSDNPRTENPEQILNDIAKGFSKASAELEIDRRTAIDNAVQGAGASDCIVIAGKGHETYQIFGNQTFHFDDREIAAQSLELPRRWCVVGGGVSGVAVAKYLIANGDPVVISDAKMLPSGIKAELQNLGVQVKDGGHDASHLSDASAIVTSPGVSAHHPLLVGARERGLVCASEIDLGLEFFPGKVVAVTGTNGKSTTVALTDHLLRHAGFKSSVAGNIGLPPTALDLKHWPAHSALALELSSYQLETSHQVRANVAMITSFSYDHIARHGSLKQYFDAKWRITEGLSTDDLLLLRGDVYQFAASSGVKMPGCQIKVVSDDRKLANSLDLPIEIRSIWLDGCLMQDHEGTLADLSALPLVGVHNRVNAAFSLLAASAIMGQSISALVPHLAGFLGLPHRCQIIGFTPLNKPIINDSKSTNVESTLIALSAVQEPCVLLVGGQGKGEAYTPLLRERDKIKMVLAFGASRHELSRDLGGHCHLEEFVSMRDGVLRAIELAKNEPVAILLSPGCASFDEFGNFEHRGDVFRELVNSIAVKRA